MSTIRLSVAAASLALAASVAAPTAAAPVANADGRGAPPTDLARAVGDKGGLWAPTEVTVTQYGRGKNIWLTVPARLVAGTEPIELRTHRASYTQPIRTTWQRGTASGTIPVTQKDLRKLYGLTTLTVRDASGAVVKQRALGACLATLSTPSRLDAPPTSPYPDGGCPWNPFALGMVQGVQAGWSAPLWENGLRITATSPSFDMTVTLGKAYADALGIPEADRSATTHVVVKRARRGGASERKDPGSTGDDRTPPAPDLGSEPTTRAAGAPAGNEPDLRALPATQVTTGRQGTLLRFETAIWNAGPGHFVVDGFRDHGSSSMTGYQMFFDANGVGAGHQRLAPRFYRLAKSGWEWRTNAITAYRLVDRSGRTVAEASRSTLCSASIDMVDLTVPRALWRPYDTPFITSCDGSSAMSARYAIPSGLGEYSYRWSRAEGLDISGLPQGWYRLEVTANPSGILMETDKTNNTSTRTLWLGPEGPRRKVRTAPVGLVDDSNRRR